jgi:DNA-binding CsgD family transcriptional regulator
MKSSDRYNSIKVKDNQGNTFNSYREAGRYWNISVNTVKNDVLKRTKKGKNFKRKVLFERG